MNIYNLPKYHDKHLYYEIISRKIDVLRKLPWVIDVFQMGSIGCPGISDVDLIIVTKDNGFNGTGCHIKTEGSEYFFLHDALWLRERDLDLLPYLFCTEVIYTPAINDTQQLLAKKFSLTKYQKLIFFVEISFNKLMQVHSGSKNEIDARGLLTRASSVIHSVALANELDIKDLGIAKEFEHSMKKLRMDWVESKGLITIDYEKIYSGYSNALVNLLESFVEQRSDYFEARPSLSVTAFFKSRGVRTNKNFKYDSLNNELIIPYKMVQYFSGYDNRVNTPFGEAQYKRKCLLEDHRKYLFKNKLTYSLRSVPAVPLSKTSRYSTIAVNLIKRKFIRYI